MASYSKFQVSRNKASKGINVFERGRHHRKEESKSERLMQSISIWASFYRANPHRFCKEYLGINLKIFQQIILYAMMTFNYSCYFAARGQGKTFLTAVFCVVVCILKPSTKVIISSGVKSQAREVIEKIDDMRKESSNLDREISNLSTSANDPIVEFHNGSWIKIVASNDNSRSKRSNLLIVDEFRMVDLNVINSVLRKFQTTPRQPKYLNKPEYAHMTERNKEIYLSSAWYKSHHSWDRFQTYLEAMLEGKSYFLCGLPYHISIREGLLMEEQVRDEMTEKSFDPVSFNIEMRALFHGISDKAFFSFEDLQKNRKIVRSYYPREVTDYLNDKSILLPKKENGEIRVVSADIATMAGAENDASAYTVARLIPTSNGYDRQVIYIETLEGGHTGMQALRITQLFKDFNCDFIVLDTAGGGGIGVYDRLTEIQIDTERGTEYEAMSCMNDERLAERCVYSNAPKIIYSIRATAQLNSEIASNFKDTLKRGKIKLPVPENEAEDFLKKVKGYNNLPEEIKLKFRMPHIQTTLMINEVLNLESEINDVGIIRLKEVGRARKDRYSSISYLNYFASELEVKNRRRKQTITPTQMFMIKKPVPY